MNLNRVGERRIPREQGRYHLLGGATSRTDAGLARLSMPLVFTSRSPARSTVLDGNSGCALIFEVIVAFGRGHGDFLAGVQHQHAKYARHDLR
ncbi:hypothetical protein DTO271G3_3378 [Paecilomyces variotii]|nr:hypothetical protein DTO271G3_3378 [Paecilomyces variotii]